MRGLGSSGTGWGKVDAVMIREVDKMFVTFG
jgi:hypothetical protein